jgi:hypothetical protein
LRGVGAAALLHASGGGSDAPAPGPAAKAWQGAELIETDDTGGAGEPDIAFDGQGNAMAVWQQPDPAGMGSKISIWARHYSASSGWGTAGRIEADDVQNGSDPRVAMDANGNAIAVWEIRDNNGANSNIVANRYVAGTGTGAGAGAGAGSGWGIPLPIELPDQNPSNYQIAVNASGNATVVWQQFDQTDGFYNIRANHFVAGTGADTGWGTAQLLETQAADGDARYPHVVLAASGHATAVWLQLVGSDDMYYMLASRYSPNAGWSTPSPISPPDALGLPQLALDAAGNAIAIWFGSGGGGFQVWSNRCIAGQWGTAAPLDTTNNTNFEPHIAMARNGVATAVWAARIQPTGGAAYTVIRASRTCNASSASSASSPWSTPVPLNVPGSDVADAIPQVATDANGNAVVVWEQRDADGVRQLWASHYLTTTNAWSSPQRLDKATAIGVRSWSIAMDAAGNAIAVWSQVNPVGNVTRTDVYYNLLR